MRLPADKSRAPAMQGTAMCSIHYTNTVSKQLCFRRCVLPACLQHIKKGEDTFKYPPRFRKSSGVTT
jgi:hypothetical protein